MLFLQYCINKLELYKINGQFFYYLYIYLLKFGFYFKNNHNK